MTDASKGVATFKLTKKYEAIDPLARPIVTAYLDECEYSLFARLPANQIIKQRYKISSLGHEFSLDVFEGALCGLELLEIESPSNKMLLAIQAPDWILREVSHETGFQGGNLANNTE